MAKINIKDEDFLIFFEEVRKDPELGNALLNPKIIGNNIEELQKVNKAISYPFLICENPDTELPLVKSQLNFLVPQAIRKSKEIDIINIKNDLNNYRKLYEKYSKKVNDIILKTRESMKNLYQPLKKLRDETKANSNNFEETIKQTSTPLQNRKESLNRIDYKKYSQEKQKTFKIDKNKVIDEITSFLNETQTFYENYEKINKKNLKEIENFVQQFMDLAKPAKELTTFMRKYFKAFEQSASKFNDLNDKKKMNEAFQKIKEPINEFILKSENTKNLLAQVENIDKEKIENISIIIEENNKIMKNLQNKSNEISNQITEIRKKYGEKEELPINMSIVEQGVLNTLEASQKVSEEKKEIDKDAEKNKNELIDDADIIIKQSRLNLLFIMDITSSMDIYLNEAKSGIINMINKIQEKCAGIEIFLGFIGYKDFSDLDFGEEYINLEFTKDDENVKKIIQKAEAGGGGDTPEDLCSALEFAKNKKWTGKSRFAILVTDSPCHGIKYHDLKEDQQDNYPEGDRNKRNIEEYIEFFAKNEISLYCLKINSTTDKMFKIFQDIYEKNKTKDSKNNFVVQQGKNIFNIVTENAVKTFQNRKKLEIKD